MLPKSPVEQGEQDLVGLRDFTDEHYVHLLIIGTPYMIVTTDGQIYGDIGIRVKDGIKRRENNEEVRIEHEEIGR